jgi:Holliday junction resolvase RusA-like endonuclease
MRSNVSPSSPLPLWQGTILGQPASKSNGRQIVLRRSRKTGKTYKSPIKSDAALNYVDSALWQLKSLKPREPIGEDVSLTCHIWYEDRRSDLDESLVMDVLQAAGILQNDRQIRQKHIFGYVDKHRPRAVIVLERV